MMLRLTFPLVVLGLALAAAAPAQAKRCDAACVTAAGEAVFDALMSGAPGKAIASSVRITENGRDIRQADSQLFAIRRVTYRQTVAEPVAGMVGFVGAAEAAGGPAVFAVRVKLKGDRAAEIETVVTRRTESLRFAPDALGAAADWNTAPPPDRRTPRPSMIAAANAYLDGGARGDVERWENGVRTDGDAQPAGSESARDRRFPLVDEVRGLVWAFAVIDRPGGSRRAPRSVLAAELLRIVDGRVEAALAVTRDLPEGASAGWALPKPPKTKKGP